MKLILSVDKKSCIKILKIANRIFSSRYTCFNYQANFQLSNNWTNVFDTDEFQFVLKFANIDLVFSQIDDLIKSMEKGGKIKSNIDYKELKIVFADSSVEAEN